VDSLFSREDNGPQLLLFGGKGGVGKTTCAAAAALRSASTHSQASFLLVSIDPAHSLADSLASFLPPANLQTLEFEAEKSLAEFKDAHRGNLFKIASRGTFLDEEDIHSFLELSLPGLDELMAFLEISRWVEERKYDCIFVDTAPTGHTLRLLGMPDFIRAWLNALDTLLGKYRYMKEVFRGSYVPDEVDRFLVDQCNSVRHMRGVLKDPNLCRFVPVALAEDLSILETITLLTELERTGIPVEDIIFNKLYPENSCPVCRSMRSLQRRRLNGLPQTLLRYRLLGIPLFPEEIRGAKALEAFSKSLSLLKIPGTETASLDPEEDAQPAYQAPMVEGPSLPIPSRMELLIFAGKGGVGKTTLACATAIWLAQHAANKEVFLFSTDPAHSLSECLATRIGNEPVKIMTRLTAMEINARQEFGVLKEQYAEELDSFLGAVLANIDLKFDHEVMKTILDLCPPGLDEVMALTRAMEFLREGGFDIFVLDSAPTGHLIRLLETPEIVDQWLKAFFSIFLKYKRVFRLPKISQRLVQISKDIKKLRKLIKDPARSGVLGVSILTEMSFEETKDLFDACEGMGIHASALFLNMATAEKECLFCSSLYQSESKVKEKFQNHFPDVRQLVVYRQPDLLGLQRLETLGKALFERLPHLERGTGGKAYA
jgi:arsenite-transporting ATPase